MCSVGGCRWLVDGLLLLRLCCMGVIGVVIGVVDLGVLVCLRAYDAETWGLV